MELWRLLAPPLVSIGMLYAYAVSVALLGDGWPTHNDPDPSAYCTACDIATSVALLLTLASPLASPILLRGVASRIGAARLAVYAAVWMSWFLLLRWDPGGAAAWLIE